LLPPDFTLFLDLRCRKRKVRHFINDTTLTKKSQYSADFFGNFQLINKAADKSAAFFEKKQQLSTEQAKLPPYYWQYRNSRLVSQDM